VGNIWRFLARIWRILARLHSRALNLLQDRENTECKTIKKYSRGGKWKENFNEKNMLIMKANFFPLFFEHPVFLFCFTFRVPVVF